MHGRFGRRKHWLKPNVPIYNVNKRLSYRDYCCYFKSRSCISLFSYMYLKVQIPARCVCVCALAIDYICVPFLEVTILSFYPVSWNIAEYVTRVTRWVQLVEQDLLTFTNHSSSPTVVSFYWDRSFCQMTSSRFWFHGVMSTMYSTISKPEHSFQVQLLHVFTFQLTKSAIHYVDQVWHWDIPQ